jgi:hypothetical protein
VTAVVVTDISSYKAVVIARFLKRAYPGLRVIGTDHRPIAKFFRTRWLDAFEPLNVSPKSADAYAAALKAVAHNHGATHLIPVNSSEIRGLMERRAVIGALLDYVGSSDLYRQLDDKQLFAALIDAQGLPQPRFRLSSSPPGVQAQKDFATSVRRRSAQLYLSKSAPPLKDI